MNKYIQMTIRNILSAIVLIVYVVYIIHLAIGWSFNDLWDVVAFVAIALLLFPLAMAGIAGAQSAGKKRQLS